MITFSELWDQVLYYIPISVLILLIIGFIILCFAQWCGEVKGMFEWGKFISSFKKIFICCSCCNINVSNPSINGIVINK